MGFTPRNLKPRRYAGLYAISEAQRRTIIGWLKEHTYKQVCVLTRERLGIKTSEAALGTFYRRNAVAILGRAAVQPGGVPATGTAVTIHFEKPGQVRLFVGPIVPEGEAAGGEHMQAGESTVFEGRGVEIVGICQRTGEVKLAVYAARENTDEPSATGEGANGE